MRLINAGLGRTGTTSLKVALEILGLGPCFHMFDVVGDEQRAKVWERIVCEGERLDWNEVFAGYTSAVDGPCAIYYDDLSAAFPEAQLMLTVRDADEWYRSTYDTLFQFALRTRQSAPPPGSQPERVSRITNSLVWDGLFGGRFAEKSHAIAVYERHNAEVIEKVGRDRLLVWSVAQGWGPLCEYLGVEPPAAPFPRANDTAWMRARIAQLTANAP